MKIGPVVMEEMSLKDCSIFSPCRHLVQGSGTIWAILIQRSFLKSFIKIRKAVMEEMSFKGFSISSPGGHLVKRSGTIWAILVQGHPTIIPGKFYQNRPSGYGGDVI